MDTLPVQDLFDYLQKQFIERATDFAMGQILLLTGPLAGSLSWTMRMIGRPVIKYVVSKTVYYADQISFKLNTAVVTTDQAKDYRVAVAAVLQLPANAPPEEWERLEREADHKFDELFNTAK